MSSKGAHNKNEADEEEAQPAKRMMLLERLPRAVDEEPNFTIEPGTISMLLMSQSAEAILDTIGCLFVGLLFVAFVCILVWVLNRNASKASEDLLTALLVWAGLAAASEALTKRFAFLGRIDWATLGEDLRRALEEASRELDSVPNGLARLDKAQELLGSGGNIERDAAAMLASATLELGLRTLAKRQGIEISPEEESLVGLAIRLGKANVITRNEQESIRHYAVEIRNRVMHGELSFIDPQEVNALINFARTFFGTHRIT